MADVDSRDNRRDYRGGGGYGGRSQNKRKRNREDDDFDNGNGNGYRNQRPRQNAAPGTLLRRGLVELAEDPLRLPHEVAANLGKLAAENWEDEYVRDTFCVVALKLVVEQPFKIPFLAGVVLFANAENADVAKQVVGEATPLLQELLAAGQWREFKLMLRFLACMSQLYEEDGIIPILDELFNRAVDLQTASPDDAVGIELVKIILLTLPYLLVASEDASLQQKVSEMLEKTDIVASTPHPIESLVDPYPNTTEQDEKPMACTSVIALLQHQLQDEATNGWPLKCIPRVYDPNHKPLAADDEAVEESNSEAKEFAKLAFPAITVPSPVNPGAKVLFPEIYFSLYADQEIESVPSTASIASSLLRDAILDTVNILDFNRNATARYLNEIDCYWAPGTFVKRATAFDKLRDMPLGKPTWKPEDVAIDAIFSQIYQLPAPEHRLVYYHSLITESCKISPGAIAPSLGRAIRFLFRNVDTMDMELVYRLMDWFGHHLSNFEFRWKWAEWIPELDLSNLQTKKAFIIGTLDKEIQLSFAKRVRDTLPQEYHPLIPASKENDVPPFKYADDTTPFAKEGREILQMLRKKAPETDVETVLNAVHQQAAAQGLDPLVASTDIYMTAICSIGSKSLSHVLSTIDRCKDRLLAVGPASEAARRQMISSVVVFWADHPGTAVNIVDKLLNYTIVTPMSVVQWALQDRVDGGRALANSQIYELVAITMAKVTNRVRQVLRGRNNATLPWNERVQIDEVLPRERQGMRDLFTAIEDAVAQVSLDESADEEERQLIQLWATRWARVWRRKAAVEEAIVGEAVVLPLGEEPIEEVMEIMEEGGDDGVGEDMDQVV
ncbi:hypothetical protein LTR08_006035 [Meristemomyces frigidus]|nr:hypothetical protein LTR08_006035 [Meristemomyces frigidus]